MEDQKVVSLWGEPVSNGEHYPDVVEYLEDVLTSARRGEVVSVTVVSVRPDLMVCNGSVAASVVHKMLLVAGLERSKNRLLSDQDMVPVYRPEDEDAPA